MCALENSTQSRSRRSFNATTQISCIQNWQTLSNLQYFLYKAVPKLGYQKQHGDKLIQRQMQEEWVNWTLQKTLGKAKQRGLKGNCQAQINLAATEIESNLNTTRVPTVGCNAGINRPLAFFKALL